MLAEFAIKKIPRYVYHAYRQMSKMANNSIIQIKISHEIKQITSIAIDFFILFWESLSNESIKCFVAISLYEKLTNNNWRIITFLCTRLQIKISFIATPRETFLEEKSSRCFSYRYLDNNELMDIGSSAFDNLSLLKAL